MNLDWRRLKAVVLESDDWGLCAWVPDEEAFRALASTAAWRAGPGGVYGRSTLERAEDVGRLVEALLEFRGGDGFPPVLQANTVMATPDFERLRAPAFTDGTLPLVHYPEFPSRWRRPGLDAAVRRAMDQGVWCPELHGLLHLPQAAWLRALRSGDQDARLAMEHQCFVCPAVEAAAEYDPSEPAALRKGSLTLAAERFGACFGRRPDSLCAPDYRWDDELEAGAESLGITTIQGDTERFGHPFPRLRRALHQLRWPRTRGRRFYMPPRIAFEPRGGRAGARVGAAAAHRAARGAWLRGQPAIVSTHRLNYAYLDPEWSEHGRGALRDLCARLAGDGATFMTDAEVRSLCERSWSVRNLGARGALLRHHGGARRQLRFAAPPGIAGVSVVQGPHAESARASIEGAQVAADVDPGDYVLEWRRS